MRKSTQVFLILFFLFIIFTGFLFNPLQSTFAPSPQIAVWSIGASNFYKIYGASAVGYTRNDTGRIFSMGGVWSETAEAINNLTIYNVNTNIWTEANPIPVPISYSATAILKDSIYLIGGEDNSGSVLNTVYKYNINANSWTTKTNYPLSLMSCKAVGYQDSLIYVAGGLTSNYVNSVYVYNSNSNSWRTATALPGARAYGAFSRIGDTLVYVGGYYGTQGYATTYKGIISQSDRSIITWTQGANYPAGPIYDFDAAPWGNLGIITAGGTIYNQGNTSKCFVYSPGANIWTSRPDKNVPEKGASLGSAYIGNNTWKLIASSGVNGVFFDTTEILTETIQTAPTAAPVLTSPTNNSANVSVTPIMSWNTVSNVTNYRMQISSDSLFRTINLDSLTSTNNAINVPSGKLGCTTKYFWRVCGTNSAGAGPWSNVWNFTTITQSVLLNVKVYLEGFWNGSTQVQDTIKLYLANTVYPYQFVDSIKGISFFLGTVHGIFTKAPNGNYYIVVQHRNHLQTWSATALTFTTNVNVTYDFTTAANKAYGNNMKQAGSVWVLYGGDANMDGYIDAFDIAILVAENGGFGYLSSDFNGDGFVDALDIPILIANNGLSMYYPTLMSNPNGQTNINNRKEETKKQLEKMLEKKNNINSNIKKIIKETNKKSVK
jgi:hypothetical protein